MSESAYHRSHNRLPSLNSAESGRLSQRDITPPLSPSNPGQPHDETRAYSPVNFEAARPIAGGTPLSPAQSAGLGDTSLKRIGRAIVSRAARAARRGNLPFIVVFISCLGVFFSALAGIGYVDPDAVVPASAAAPFMPGVPVFDPIGDNEIARRRRADERRELEQQWQKKRRPQDGAWMQKQRDDKAIRRKPVVSQPETETFKQHDDIDKRDGFAILPANTQTQEKYDLGGSVEPYIEPETGNPVLLSGLSVDQMEQEQEQDIEQAM